MDDGQRALEEIQQIENQLLNPALEKQVEFDLKTLFTAKLVEVFKKDINKDDDMSIEKSKITRKQINYLIDILESKNHKAGRWLFLSYN